MSLGGDHDVRLVKHEDGNFLQIEEFELDTPIQHLAGCPDDDVIGDLGSPGDLFTPDGVPNGEVWAEL